MLGSNYEPVREKVIELLASCGPVTGMLHSSETALARLIHDFMPGVHKFRMLGSGTEAVMAAIRAARAYTGKANIIKIGGAYHGWSDQVVYGLRIPGTGQPGGGRHPRPARCPRTSEILPGDLDTLRAKLAANAEAGGTAAVILEPVGPESGSHPAPRDFNAAVRELCDEFGTLLVFDEVVTGFRLGMGGAQGYYGVSPDLTVFGKCVAGGYPGAGGVGGREEVMAVYAGGLTAARAAGAHRRHPVGQPAVVHRGLPRPARDGPHGRAGQGRRGRRPADASA